MASCSAVVWRSREGDQAAESLVFQSAAAYPLVAYRCPAKQATDGLTVAQVVSVAAAVVDVAVTIVAVWPVEYIMVAVAEVAVASPGQALISSAACSPGHSHLGINRPCCRDPRWLKSVQLALVVSLLLFSLCHPDDHVSCLFYLGLQGPWICSPLQVSPAAEKKGRDIGPWVVAQLTTALQKSKGEICYSRNFYGFADHND